MVQVVDTGRWLNRLAAADGILLERVKWALRIERTESGTACTLVNFAGLGLVIEFDAGQLNTLRLAHADKDVASSMRSQAGLPPSSPNRWALPHAEETKSV